jgi:uncharacterized protein (DUF885 family)
MPHRLCRVGFLSVYLALNAMAGAQPTSRSGDLADFVRLYQTDNNGVSRFYDLPRSEQRLDRMDAVYKDWQAKLAAVDFAALDQQGKIDYILLRNEIANQIAKQELERRWLAEIDEALPFRKPIQTLELTRWKMEPVNAAAAAEIVSKIPDQVKKARERVEKGRKEAKADGKPESKKSDGGKAGASETVRAEPKLEATPERKPETKQDERSGAKSGEKPEGAPIKLSAVEARRAASAVGEIRGTLRDWYGFYDGYQPEFTWWLKKPHDEAAAALDDYARYLREEVAGLKGKDEDPLVGDPIGAAALAEDLKAEVIPYTPEQLIAIGEKEFAWCEAEMKKAAAEMGFGDDWKAALKKVKDDHVPPGQQDDLVAEQSRFVIQWLKDRNLVSIPPLCEETWRLTMISPQVQKTLPFAAYGGQNMMVAYPTDSMKQEDKLMSMRGNNKHFTRIVTPHELIPGHHLQGFMAQRERPYRGVFSTPFLVEGWALYWEMLLWDLQYPQTPEDRIGMLFWRMHRGARIIVSLKYHLGQMQPQEMIDFLVERVGHERFGATSEVRRFIGGDYSPLYQCGYMIGGLQIRALRKELVDSGKMTDKQFHDAILTYGPIPVEMIRAGLENLPLTNDAQAAWKFAGEEPGK